MTRDAAVCLGLSTFGYDTALRVRVSRDPIEEKGGLNLYGYTENNPVNLSDPLGLIVGGPWDDTTPPEAIDAIRKVLDSLQSKEIAEYLANHRDPCPPSGTGIFQIGLSLNGQWGPLSGNFSKGLIFDKNGGFGYYTSGGGGIGLGAKVSGGISLGTSTGQHIEDYAGPFNNVSVGAAGGISASADSFWGTGARGQLVVGGGLTIGAGLGGGGSGGGSVTSVTRIW